MSAQAAYENNLEIDASISFFASSLVVPVVESSESTDFKTAARLALGELAGVLG